MMQKNDTVKKMQESCHGEWLAFHDNSIIKDLVIDSRKITQAENALFIAIKTPLRNGHGFIQNAYEKGIRNFLVSEKMDTTLLVQANVLLVKDTLTALQQIAAAHRKQFRIPVIGITGSNGKTIVKEWLHQLLNNIYNTVRSPKSFNSQIGVPLSVWLLDDKSRLGIFEAGISQPGEMDKLESIIQPTIGVFTNIGEAHSEGFLSLRQKINEKLLLFRHAEKLVYCRDHLELHECIAQYTHALRGNSGTPLQLFTWSQKHEADLCISSISSNDGKTHISANYKGKEAAISIPFTDAASVENAMHCWSVMLLLGIPQADITTLMQNLHSVSMRLELQHGINDCTIINDTYNSDLTSLHIALDYLEQQKQHPLHSVILSDMLQTGIPDRELYEQVADMISRRNIKRFIGIGPSLYKNKAAFKDHKKLRTIFFKSTDAFLQNVHLINFENEAILLKGARAFVFEKIGVLLEQKIHQTALYIDLSALTHNLNVFRSHLQPGVKTMAMVKAFAYGSGSYEIAHLLQFAGVDYLSVAYTDEGIGLRKAGITMPIMVMSPDATSFDRMIAWKLEPEIFNVRSLGSFIEIATTLNVKNYPVHIKLDTGMHRLGFMQDEIAELTEQLNDAGCIQIASIFSHLVSADEPADDAFTMQQATAFEQMSADIIKYLSYKPLLHLSNSAATARLPQLQYDMVRLGIGLYGADSSHTLQDQLKQISTLKTTIAQIKHVPAGDSIGYGRKTIAAAPMRIATICIGYADGYPRALGNGNAYVLIHGKKAKTTGIICMDMCMVDITHIPEAKEGDEAILFGPELPVTDLAVWADTIPYEMMTGISQRVKRIYTNEQ